MASVLGTGKRLLLGRAVQSQRLGDTLLPKKLALPVFASDALSSVAYATEEILLVLSAGGLAFLHYTWGCAIAVGLLMVVVVASYRKTVHAYPSGGGDYEVATKNLGPAVGVTVASALLVDYTLTVAVSVSSGVANLASAFPSLHGHALAICLLLIAVITLLNLRGLRESGTAFAIPTYFFIAVISIMIIWGFIQIITGHPLTSESAHVQIKAQRDFAGVALLFLILRAFASGCTALTGVEAISNGVPAFKPPKSKNAATTLALLGVIAVSMFMGVTALALASHVHVAAPADLVNPGPDPQRTVIAQVGRTVFGDGSPLFYILQLVTALILILAANTAFNGFPVLTSILAHDGYAPKQLRTRGDRLAYSNGIVLLAGFAMLLIVAFDASPTRLIQLYIIGVFVSFTCSETGMVRHWNRLLRNTEDHQARSEMRRSRLINFIGAIVCGFVLVIVLITKFANGAWIVVVAMPIIWLLLQAVHRHYANVSKELTPIDEHFTLPSRNHAIVLVSRLHRPALRALAYAQATGPSRLEALTVAADQEDLAALRAEWDRRKIPIPLTVIGSPYRETTRPIVEYVARLRRESPRDIVTIYIPEYVVGHWWERLLHNQSALRLKSRLIRQRGVVLASVPWQLKSSTTSDPGDDRVIAPGVRFGGGAPLPSDGAAGDQDASAGVAAAAGTGSGPTSEKS